MRGRALPIALIVVGLAIGLYALVGIGGGDGEGSKAEGDDQLDLYSIVLEDIRGNTVDFSSFRGKKVALWFMATWCPSCAVAGQVLREAIRRTGEDVIVVAIDMWTEENLRALGLLGSPGIPRPETEADLARFLEVYGDREWIGVMDRQGLMRVFGVRNVDTLYIFDGTGRVLYVAVAPSDVNTVARYLEAGD